MTICAIDVGGTGSRIRVDDGDGRRAERAGSGIRVGTGGPDIAEMFAVLGPLVREATESLRHEPVDAVDAAAIGQSGLLMLGARSREVHAGLAAVTGARRTIVASDALTSLIGALGLRPGAVVAAGTGCIGFGTDLADTWNRVDGWGHILGDDGGGSWIGKKALQAALRAHDGRPGGSAELRDRLVERFGRPDDLTALLYSAPDRAGILASFAADTASAARGGDTVAAGIWSEAGVRIARCAAAALDGVEPVVAFVGGITASRDLFADALGDELERLRPGAEVVDAAGTALDGAATLARSLLGRPAAPAPLDRAPYVTALSRPS